MCCCFGCSLFAVVAIVSELTWNVGQSFYTERPSRHNLDLNSQSRDYKVAALTSDLQCVSAHEYPCLSPKFFILILSQTWDDNIKYSIFDSEWKRRGFICTVQSNLLWCNASETIWAHVLRVCVQDNHICWTTLVKQSDETILYGCTYNEPNHSKIVNSSTLLTHSIQDMFDLIW